MKDPAAEIEQLLAAGGALEAQFFGAHRRWRAQRGLEPSLGFPGIRYVLLHSLSHALIRQFSVECGYAAASLREAREAFRQAARRVSSLWPVRTAILMLGYRW